MENACRQSFITYVVSWWAYKMKPYSYIFNLMRMLDCVSCSSQWHKVTACCYFLWYEHRFSSIGYEYQLCQVFWNCWVLPEGRYSSNFKRKKLQHDMIIPMCGWSLIIGSSSVIFLLIGNPFLFYTGSTDSTKSVCCLSWQIPICCCQSAIKVSLAAPEWPRL